MTDDSIFEMAIKASKTAFNEREFLVNFAALVAAHEREQCAKACEAVQLTSGERIPGTITCATVIRARGNQ